MASASVFGEREESESMEERNINEEGGKIIEKREVRARKSVSLP